MLHIKVKIPIKFGRGQTVKPLKDQYISHEPDIVISRFFILPMLSMAHHHLALPGPAPSRVIELGRYYFLSVRNHRTIFVNLDLKWGPSYRIMKEVIVHGADYQFTILYCVLQSTVPDTNKR